MDFVFKNLEPQHLNDAIKLSLEVFMQFEAPMYSEDGIEAFSSFVLSDTFKDYFYNPDNIFVGCFKEDELIGVVGMRSPTHVTIAFVNKQYHRCKIATTLFNMLFDIARLNGVSEITLNSSPYAVPFYHNIGFVDTDIQKEDSGIIFTPMKISI